MERRIHKTWPRRTTTGLFVLLLVVSSERTARAGDTAAAQELFEEGKALMTQGRYADACPKLEESQRIDQGMGTEFHLATCYERTGRTASAWARFLDVAALAKAAGQGAREQAARERARALEPRLTRLAVRVAPSATLEGLVVRRDDVEIGSPQWGAPVPVDPGFHDVSAAAPGKITWTTRVRVEGDASPTAVDVPPLADALSAPQEPAMPTPRDLPATPRESSHGSTQRVLGGVVTTIGLVGIGVGAGFGIAAKAKHDDAAAHCAGNACDATGVGLREDAIRNGNIATVALATGGGVFLGGVLLWLTAPHGTEIQATPVGTSGMGLSFRGAW